MGVTYTGHTGSSDSVLSRMHRHTCPLGFRMTSEELLRVFVFKLVNTPMGMKTSEGQVLRWFFLPTAGRAFSVLDSRCQEGRQGER